MPAVISDASVLISLGAVGQVDLLREFYQTIIVPDTVWQEVTGAAAASLPGARETIQANQQGWLSIQRPSQQTLIAALRSRLGAGEAEAIALASELEASLILLDEVEGRAIAQGLGLTVTGTLGVLLRAKQTGKVSALKPVLNTLLQQHSFRLSRSLYEQALRLAGEIP